jgi:hypothetical protein
MKNRWLEIDKEGLKRSLGQKDKVFLLTEMVSNAWDEDITGVEVTLSRPDEKGFSWLRVVDDSPTGWQDLSHAHTMFAESIKKGQIGKARQVQRWREGCSRARHRGQADNGQGPDTFQRRWHAYSGD